MDLLAPRVEMFGVEIDVVTMEEAVQQISSWLAMDGDCRFVVTPNIDHVVLLQERGDLQAAYHDASLVVADGWPVVAASRLLRRPLPERVPGSDLVPQLFDRASDIHTLRVFLLGAAPGIAELASENIHAQWPAVKVVGTYSPPLGFEHSEAENVRILKHISDLQPDLLIVGLGAPKQELWVQQNADQLETRVALCVGATIDFLAGHRRRAPRWMQRCGLEWLHRLSCEPKRLFRRYAKDALVFPRLVLREMLK